MAKTDHLKHKTIGVSFPPQLRLRAAERARSLSLSFSKYVTLCIESELEGRTPQQVVEHLLPEGKKDDMDLDAAIEQGTNYGAMKAASINFEDDIEAIMKQEEFSYERSAPVGHLRTDFLVTHVNEKNGKERKIALECKFNIANRGTVALGQAVILKSLPAIDGVVLCVPYLRHFDAHARDAFLGQGIPVATPDNIADVLRDIFKKAK